MTGDDSNLTSPLVDHEMVNRLVREVIRRLTDMKLSESITIGEKVITASVIEQLPKTQKRISVADTAIITPAARDEAQRRNISIERNTIKAKQAVTQPIADAMSGISDSASPERAAAVTEQLRRRGVRLPSAPIVLSETPGREVFEQCTQHKRRSVMIASLADVDRFNAEMSPTSWVLDMTRLNLVAAINVAARIAQLET